jgi:hypothetical protein
VDPLGVVRECRRGQLLDHGAGFGGQDDNGVFDAFGIALITGYVKINITGCMSSR